MSYLRLTRHDFETISRLCRPIDLGDDFFPSFKAVLVKSLATTCPDLASRIASLRGHRLRLLYDRLRELRGQRPTGTRHGLTSEEFAAFAEACRVLTFPGRLLSHFRDFLAGHFDEAMPALGKKLARMRAHQFRRLYAHASDRQKRTG